MCCHIIAININHWQFMRRHSSLRFPLLSMMQCDSPGRFSIFSCITCSVDGQCYIIWRLHSRLLYSPQTRKVSTVEQCSSIRRAGNNHMSAMQNMGEVINPDIGSSYRPAQILIFLISTWDLMQLMDIFSWSYGKLNWTNSIVKKWSSKQWISNPEIDIVPHY